MYMPNCNNLSTMPHLNQYDVDFEVFRSNFRFVAALRTTVVTCHIDTLVPTILEAQEHNWESMAPKVRVRQCDISLSRGL